MRGNFLKQTGSLYQRLHTRSPVIILQETWSRCRNITDVDLALRGGLLSVACLVHVDGIPVAILCSEEPALGNKRGSLWFVDENMWVISSEIHRTPR